VLARFGDPMPARGGVAMVQLPHGASDIAPIVRALDEAGLSVESLEVVKPTLDDVFVAKTGRHLEGEAQAQRDAAAAADRAAVEEAAPA
jgi:ABC-2 type transport system ATP-binding protein